MAIGKIIEKILSGIVGEGISIVKETVDDTLGSIVQKVEIAVKHTIKKLMVFIISFLAFIFILVGLGKYLSETIDKLNHGLGYILVGAILLFIAIIGRLFQSN